MKLIVATENTGKLREYQEMLGSLDIECISLKDIGFTGEIMEDGKTFIDNSYRKAKAIYDMYKKPVIADDSGLSVEALNAFPGVHSHRYASLNATDKENIEKVLFELKKLNKPPYNAHFTCAITYIDDARVIQVEGRLDGEIILEERGYNGFGYDSIFYLKEYDKTVAELNEGIKNQISHRHKALDKLIRALGIDK